jgi:hypothetical protein
MAYPATPKTWVAGDVLTAAQLNAELRDALLGAFPLGPPDAGWTSYTPTLVQTGAVTKTVTYAKYIKIGRLVVATVHLTVTGTGTATSRVDVGLPVAAPATVSTMPAGTFFLRDASASTSYHGVALFASTTTVLGIASGQLNYFGFAAFTAALAVGDEIGLTLAYEAAA